jgi:hypothetical protein
MERGSARIALSWWLTLACLIGWAALRPGTYGLSGYDIFLGIILFLQVIIAVDQHRTEVH